MHGQTARRPSRVTAGSSRSRCHPNGRLVRLFQRAGALLSTPRRLDGVLRGMIAIEVERGA